MGYKQTGFRRLSAVEAQDWMHLPQLQKLQLTPVGHNQLVATLYGSKLQSSTRRQLRIAAPAVNLFLDKALGYERWGTDSSRVASLFFSLLAHDRTRPAGEQGVSIGLRPQTQTLFFLDEALKLRIAAPTHFYPCTSQPQTFFGQGVMLRIAAPASCKPFFNKALAQVRLGGYFPETN